MKESIVWDGFLIWTGCDGFGVLKWTFSLKSMKRKVSMVLIEGTNQLFPMATRKSYLITMALRKKKNQFNLFEMGF